MKRIAKVVYSAEAARLLLDAFIRAGAQEYGLEYKADKQTWNVWCKVSRTRAAEFATIASEA